MNKPNLYYSTKLLIQEAKKRNYQVQILLAEKNFLEISKNGQSIYIKATCFPINSEIGSAIANDKELTAIVLKENNLPTLEYYVCDSLKKVISYEKKLQFPLVIKPLNLAHGTGVIAGINNSLELRKYANESINKYGEIILQKFVTGNDYRLLVVDGKFVSALQRIPARVIGNGKNNIEKLIDIENQNPDRGEGYSKVLLKIKIDKETKTALEKQRLSLQYIPKKGEIVYLKKTANVSKGGEVESVTEKIHDDYKTLAQNAAKVVGLKFVGVDIIGLDITKSLQQSPSYIIELNARPSIDIHETFSSDDHVLKAIFDMLEKYYFK